MTFDFVPDSMKIEGSKFKGSFKIESPLAEDIYDLLADCNFSIDAKGQIELSSMNNQIKSMAMMIKKTAPFVKSVSLEKEDGSKFKSYEDFRRDPDSRNIVVEVASAIMGGMRPSKN